MVMIGARAAVWGTASCPDGSTICFGGVLFGVLLRGHGGAGAVLRCYLGCCLRSQCGTAFSPDGSKLQVGVAGAGRSAVGVRALKDQGAVETSLGVCMPRSSTEFTIRGPDFLR